MEDFPVNIWHDVPFGDDAPEIINVVIEIPRGSRNKYEIDKDTGLVKLDRVLSSAVYYPGDYGLIPQTYCDDGDPLDVILLINFPTFPGCLIEARPVGVFGMIDGGENDDKILAVPANDPYFANIKDLGDVPPHFIKEVTQFFASYKALENKTVEVGEWQGAEAAKQRIQDSIQLYNDNFRKPE
ncbi:inorganic pyrophosphatase [Herpetosiphon geysericola]|uniref:Inorganic pyrophosphatase n=1 Tax=Herpetosiphon geysericola TaxID=70996 RepID=A0A0P6YD89_9CHLR|nr:inorganic pyrophosphatase [Herpetosiphon geysericola]